MSRMRWLLLVEDGAAETDIERELRVAPHAERPEVVRVPKLTVALDHLHDLEATMQSLRRLSSRDAPAGVTAALAGSGAIAVRTPERFEAIVGEYLRLLEPFLAHETDRIGAPRQLLEEITTMIGEAGGGPRDLLDIHLAALDRGLSRQPSGDSRALMYEARLLALEMMGLLVDHYRVGSRRRTTSERTL